MPQSRYYVQTVQEYRCKSCSKVICKRYSEMSISDERWAELLEEAIKQHNRHEHGKES